MKKIAISIMLFCFCACSLDDEHSEGIVVKEIVGIANHSDFDVEVTFITDKKLNLKIAKNENVLIVESPYKDEIPRCECGLYQNGCGSEPVDIIIKFANDPASCYSFIGKIKDSLADIRSISSYENRVTATVNGASVENLYYVIDSRLEELAKPCE